MQTQEKIQVLKVSELTKDIKLILESSFGMVWVQGEISNFKNHSSGHMYFTLKDDQAQISCAFFKGNNINLKFALEDGMQVVVFGRLGVYEKRGAYQLYVHKIQPKGIGALSLAFEQLKKKLIKEGLFDKKKKQSVPFLPQRIGLITSSTGAAVRDFLNIINRRFADVHIIINPVKVQGEGSAKEIVQALEDFNRLSGNKLPEIQVIILTRGGGSLEDLWSFNEEIVARAIFASKIPVISAVGHEIDFTISDFVADLRAPTPSAAAEMVLPRKDDLKEKLLGIRSRLETSIKSRCQYLFKSLDRLISSYGLRLPQEKIEQFYQSADSLSSALRNNFSYYLNRAVDRKINLITRLESLSPFKVLERGYSVTSRLPQGEALTDARNVKQGDEVETRLKKGSFRSRVIATQRTQNTILRPKE